MAAELIDAETDAAALAIFDDLFTDKPTFAYDVMKTGKYAKIIQSAIRAREHGGKAAVEGVRRAIEVAKEPSEFALLLRRREERKNCAIEQPKPEYEVAPLPASAQLPENCLPRLLDDPKQDWFTPWDSSNLRRISPFLADYIAYSNKFSPEGYIDFHVAGGLWALSTVAARRIYVPLSDEVYTPLAIAFVARTSLFAKTKTAKAAIKMVKTAGLGWLLGDDETTPQKLLADMAGEIPNNYGEKDIEGQMEDERRIAMSGQIGWYYDEFNQLIDAMTRPGPMAEFAGLLRKLDDCPDEYKYSTRTHGKEVIKQPYLPLLANTTPANLSKHASKGGEFWNDGFWARFAFITPPPDAWRICTMGIGVIVVPPPLLKKLVEWNKRLGVPHCTIEEVKDGKGNGTGRYKAVRDPLPSHQLVLDQTAYEAYVRYREAIKSLIGNNSNQDLDGSYVRLSDKALRIAGLIASLENDGYITLTIWMLAQEIAEMFRRNLHELYSQASEAPPEESHLEDVLIDFIKSREGRSSSVREIQRYAPHRLKKKGSNEIYNILKILEKDGIVESVREGRKEGWRLTR